MPDRTEKGHLTDAEEERIASWIYEAYRLGRASAGSAYLPMWHEPESRNHLPQFEIRSALDEVEKVVETARGEAVMEARAEISRMLDGFPQHGRHTRARWAVAWLDHIIDRLSASPGEPS